VRAAGLKPVFVFLKQESGEMARKKKVVEPKIGHNGGPLTADRKKQLEGYITEIERWEDQKKIIVDDIGLIYTAAKDAGFDTRAMRLIVRDRKVSRDKREAFEAIVDVYKHALGMLVDLPLGLAALAEQGKKLADDMGLPPASH
jgi:uncharacterized protein (UPF0335 family)